MTHTASDPERRNRVRFPRRQERAGTRRGGWLRVAAATVFAVAVAVGLTGQAAVAAAAPAWPTVSSGAQGPNASTVQYLLRQRGETISADGIFGAQTKAAVQRFQTANALQSDGIVGPLTWAKLVVPLDAGATGEAVRALQTQLNRFSPVTVNGTFSGATNDAVVDFKADHDLGTGTAVDVVFWQWLIGSYPGAGTYALPLAHDKQPRSEYDDPHHDYPAIDLQVGTGTPAYASAAGTVIAVTNSACGTGLQIRDANGDIFMYCHFSQRVAAGGSTVAPGQLVGYTGNTGNTTGPHLHFEIRRGGTTNVCPQPFLLAIYDGLAPPPPSALPTTGCIGAGFAGQPELD